MTSDPLHRLMLELGRLPGVGERSAARLAYYLVRSCQGKKGKSLASDLAEALLTVEREVGLCDECQNLCAQVRCAVCSDGRRDSSIVCVVEGAADVRAIEQSGGFRGRYHVLHGALAPLDGIGPGELKITELLERLKKEQIREVILATNANVEGDATSLYLASLIRPLNITTTRLAAGIPQGGELEYLDRATVGRALADRRTF